MDPDTTMAEAGDGAAAASAGPSKDAPMAEPQTDVAESNPETQDPGTQQATQGGEDAAATQDTQAGSAGGGEGASAKPNRKSGAGADRPTREDPAAADRLRAYVESIGGTLPPGWTGIYKKRVNGTSAGQEDLYYKSPEGRIMRSRADVLRLLGLDPKAGAAGADAGGAAATSSPKKAPAASGKGKKRASMKQEGGDEQGDTAAPEEGDAAAAGTAAGVIDDGPSSKSRRTSTAGGAKWTLPPEVPREEAAEAAGARAKELNLQLPFVTDKDVTVLSLGSVHNAMGFVDATHIWPLGYRAAWKPAAGVAAADAAAGSKKKRKKSDAAKEDAEAKPEEGKAEDAEPEGNAKAGQLADGDAKMAEAEAEAEADANGGTQPAKTKAEEQSAPAPAPVLYRFISEIREASAEEATAAKAPEGADAPSSSGAASAPTPSGPLFVVLLERDPEVPAPAAGASGISAPTLTEPVVVHSGSSPDAVWSAVVEMQTAAVAACKKAKASGSAKRRATKKEKEQDQPKDEEQQQEQQLPAPPPPPTELQYALASIPALGKIWGLDCYGLTDVRVLQLIEALPGVDSCQEYLYVQQRNSWDLEAAAIATKRNVVLSGRRAGAATGTAQQRKRQQQQLTMEAFVRPGAAAGAVPKPETDAAAGAKAEAGPASTKGKGKSKKAAAAPAAAAASEGAATMDKEAWEALEEAATAADKNAADAAAAAAKKATPRPPKATSAPKSEKRAPMSRDDYEIHSVLDRVVERVSILMAEPDEEERQKMLKAMEKSDRALARRRERAAEKAAEKAAGGGADGGAAAAGEAAGEAGAGGEEKKTAEKKKAPKKEKAVGEKDKGNEGEAAAKPPKPPKGLKTPKDSIAAIAAKEKAATDAAAKEAAAAAIPPSPAPPSNAIVDERTLPSAEIPAPPGLALDLSYTAAAAAAAAAALPDGARTALVVAEPTGASAGAGGDGGGLLSGEEVQQLLMVYQFLWDHRKLLGMEGRVPSLADLIVMVSEPRSRLPPAARRAADELHLALVRLLVGEALDELLAYTAETSNLGKRDLSAAVPPMTSATWPELARRYLAAAAAARYLTTSEPRSSALVSLQLPGQLQNLEPADWLHYLLAGLNFPHLLSRIALLPHASSRWAADALLTTDDARARAASERLMRGAEQFDMQNLDGEGQVRRGRRLLNELLSLPDGGQELGFYAPEFGEVLRAPRGLDLHAVAVRLDAGLYQNTDDWLQAIATDVRSSLGLWRAALSCPKGRDIPGHAEAKASMADVAERKLDELLANADTALALPQPPQSQPAADAAGDKAADGDGDVEMQDAGDEANKASGAAGGGAASGKSRKSRGGGGGSRRRKKGGGEGASQGQSQADKAEAEAPEEGEAEDPSSLDDPTRLFNPRDGCRVCWLNEDKNRLMLCDGCDGEYHCYCVEPPLLEVPEDAWFCPSCTARGMGPPKAEGDEAEAEAGTPARIPASGRGVEMATSPHQTAVTAAAGGVAPSPRSGPCSPAFQHTHSHSHLVSELQDRTAARRQQQQQQQRHAATHACGGHGADEEVVAAADEGPLCLPGDIPEGPRVTLLPHSRPGLKELAGLLRLAHLLGNYDYATGAPAGGPAARSAAGGSEGGWTPSRRLALLSALCDLALDTNALRESLEEVVEGRKKARVEANAIRSRARQIQEEQMAAKKAAAEKENAPKPPEGEEGDAAAAGAKEGGKGGGKKGKKGAKAAAPDTAAEGAEEGPSQDVKEGAGGGFKLSRHIKTDLSVLPEAELKRLMSLETQVEGMDVRQEALGEDRHGSRYWWLGADQVNPGGPQGVVLVEQVPPGQAAAADKRAGAAFAERQRRRQQEEAEELKRKDEVEARRKKKAEAKAEEAGAAGSSQQPMQQVEELDEDDLDEWGLPRERPRPRIVAIGSDSGPGASWGMYHTPDQLTELLGWLHPKGQREGPLRTALLKVRDRIAASQAPPAEKSKKGASAAATAATAGAGASTGSAPQQQQGQGQGQTIESAADGEAAGSSQPHPPAPPPPMLCPSLTLAGGGRRGGGARQGSAAPADAAAATTAATGDDGSGDEPAGPSEEALALRSDLLSLYRGLPGEAFARFWGSAERRARWTAFVESATTPQQLCAAVTVLESMLVDEALRPHWRLYCLPAQHPQLCSTWAAAGYRLAGLQGAIRKQILPLRELHHQPQQQQVDAAPERAGKAGRGAAKEQKAKVKGAAARQQQERYPSRRGGSAVTALPDISNVRSREAAALLAGNLPGKPGKRDAGGRGQKRRLDSSDADDNEDEEEEEAGGRKAANRRHGKRAATAEAKASSQRPAARGRGGRGQPPLPPAEPEEGEVEEDQEEDDEEEESASGSDSGASGSDSEAAGEGEEEEEEEASDEEESDEEEDLGRGRRSQPSRSSARLKKKEPENAGVRTRRASQRQAQPSKKAASSEEPDSDDSEDEEDARPSKRLRGGAGGRGAADRGRTTRTRAAAAVISSSDDEEALEDEDDDGAGAMGGSHKEAEKGRSRGVAAPAAAKLQANGGAKGVGSRAAAILANRKRALADWSDDEESEEADQPAGDGKGAGRQGRSSSPPSDGEEDDEGAKPQAGGRTRRGAAAAAAAAPAAQGRRTGGTQAGPPAATKKPPARRSMARSEVEYDVEDFDDLNT